MADFSCYITIVNNSSFTLKRKKLHKECGTYKSEPAKELKPREKTKFRLADKAGAFGSEGYVEYTISDAGTLKFNYDCPYGKSDNVLNFTSSDDSILKEDVFIYGNNDDNYIDEESVCECNNGKYPKRGHPLSGIFIIENPKNVKLGKDSLKSIKNGSGNTAIGYGSALSNISGSNNVALGYESLSSNTEGDFNTAVGNRALYKNEKVENTAVGSSSLEQNTIGESNVALGNNALRYNTIGNENVALGVRALENIIKGKGNTAVGYNANNKGNTINDTSNTTAIGYNAKAEYKNSTALGANAEATGENQIRLGDDNTGVYVTSLNLISDERDKTDIKDSSLGLDFILGLRPVEYRWDIRSNYEDDKKNSTKKGKRFHQGFIAQDFQSLDIDFAGFQDHKINGGEDQLTLNYFEFIAPLVKAVQEQQKIIESQQKEIDILKKKI